MSADNLIAIQKIGDRYYVWHESASNDYPYPNATAESFKKKNAAYCAAKDMYDDCCIVEYGIQELDPVDSAFLFTLGIVMNMLDDIHCDLHSWRMKNG